MKYFLLGITLCTTLLSSGLAQQTSWQWVNPLPQGNILNSVWVVSQDTVVAVAEYGTVIRSSNAGRTWLVQTNVAGITEQLFGTQFINGQLGWAVGEGGRIVKTTNGGISWSTQDPGSLHDFFSLQFISATTGWAIGSLGTIYKTIDGGTTWAAENSGTTASLYGIHFISPTTGWVVGTSGVILATTNGGTTWSPRTSGTIQSLYSLQFLSPSVGIAVGSFGVVLRTTNGGVNWAAQTSGTDFSLYSVQFTNTLTGWAVGSYGITVKTTNGGISWFEQSSGTYYDLYQVRFISPATGWAVGDFGTIIATTDGGTTWRQQSTGVKNYLNGIHFPTANLGWAVGEEGTIVKTTDGGSSWQTQPSGLYQTLFSVYMVDQVTGWAVGDSAVILKTTNGGASWGDQHSHTDISLYSVYFINASTGWTVGDYGTILGTVNGGLVWRAETTHTFTSFLRVRFANATTGWVVGYGGEIMKTTNGGSSWVRQNSGTTQILYALDVLDANTVYASGDFGTVVFTSDGGAHWSVQNTGTDAGLYGLTFRSYSLGWAVGDDGTVVATTNGGATWNQQNSGTAHTLWDIVYVPSPTGGGLLFAAGMGGTIVCSGVSPLPIRLWTGAMDSLWTNPGNWMPNGLPEKGDSVSIPATAIRPVLRTLTQQINIAGLRIAPGATLTLGSGVAQLVVEGNVQIEGTFELEAASRLKIVTGGNFSVSATGRFIPASSSLVMTGTGVVRGSFYNFFTAESAQVRSIGNISVSNNITVMSDLSLRQIDTLTILNSEPGSFQGTGIIERGTIKRAIQRVPLADYRFESLLTYLSFYPAGTPPDTVLMTVYPGNPGQGFPDSIFVRRYYTIIASGGSNYLSSMSLRYDTSETPMTIDMLALFRDSAGVVTNMGMTDFTDSDLVAIELDSVRNFSDWHIGRYDYIPKHAYAFTDSLVISNNGGMFDTLTFGAVSGASDGIDTAFGEKALGPLPPVGVFDTRWVIPSTQGTAVDFRDVLSFLHQQNLYTFSIQPGTGGYPVTIRWNISLLAPGNFILRDQATQGGQFSVNMKKQSSYVITSPSITSVQILHQTPTFYQIAQGWNMVSLPVTTTAIAKKSTIFPSAISNAFGYSTLYYVADTLRNGRGYWLKFASAQNVGIEGTARFLDSVQVVQGWNLIGSVTTPFPIGNVIQIPPGIVHSDYYTYTASYTSSDSIRPSRAYWVKCSSAGTLVLHSGGPEARAVSSAQGGEAISSFSTLTIRARNGSSQTLYFAGPQDGRSVPADEFELPPLPPEGAFDARFITDARLAYLENITQSLTVSVQSGSWPVTVEWHLAGNGVGLPHFRNAGTGELLPSGPAAPEGRLILPGPSASRFSIQMDPVADLPKEFALMQNYPNPFNPSTVIEFALPVPSRVTLKLYNLLGQEVAQVADSRAYPAGTHSLRVDAGNLGSGMYMYRITAQGANQHTYSETRKMLLVK